MHAHLLDAHEVLAGGNLVGKAELELFEVPGQPALVGAVPRDRGAQLVHLEPVSGAVVVTDVAGGFGEVDLLNNNVVSWRKDKKKGKGKKENKEGEREKRRKKET